MPFHHHHKKKSDSQLICFITNNQISDIDYTGSMDGGAFERVVLHQDGGPLIDEHIHTFNMAFEGGQIQRCVSLCSSHIQIQQRLNQYLKSLVMSMICLRTTGKQKLKSSPAIKCRRIRKSESFFFSYNVLSKQMETVLTARCRGLTGARTSESFRMSVPEVSINLKTKHNRTKWV